jgi:hypothetical protein
MRSEHRSVAGIAPCCGARFPAMPGGSFAVMDQFPGVVDGAPGRGVSISFPTGKQAPVSTLPVAVVLIIGLPLFFWWRVDVFSNDHPVSWLVSLAYYMLVIMTMGRARAPLPQPANQFSRECVKWMLSGAPRTVTVPQDTDLRVSIGVAAVLRVRRAALLSIFTLAAAITGLVHSSTFVMLIAALLGVPAIVFIARSGHSWTYLHLLHSEAQTM